MRSLLEHESTLVEHESKQTNQIARQTSSCVLSILVHVLARSPAIPRLLLLLRSTPSRPQGRRRAMASATSPRLKQIQAFIYLVRTVNAW
jgi:hypothetical protein